MDKAKFQKNAMYTFFLILMSIIHFPIYYSGDDIYLLSVSLPEIFLKRLGDSGRVLTDSVAWLCTRIPLNVWKLIDVLFFVIIAYLLVYLFTERRKEDIFIVCISFLLFPFQILSTAGYIATIANYVYPFLAMLLVLYPIRRMNLGYKNTGVCWFTILIPVMYAANHDQYAVALIFFMLLLNLATAFGKIKNLDQKFLIYEVVLSIFFYTLLFLSPGHKYRASAYGRWIPEYGEWTIFDKLYHGYTSTVAYIFYRNVPIMIAFLVILFLAAITTRKKTAIMCTLLPMGVVLFQRATGYVPVAVGPEVALGMPEIGSLASRKNLFFLILSVVMVICIFVGVYLTVEEVQSKWLSLAILLAGAGTRLMMGFSETLYGSSYRTYSFLFFAVLIVTIILLGQIYKKNNQFLLGMSVMVVLMEVISQYSSSLRSLI